MTTDRPVWNKPSPLGRQLHSTVIKLLMLRDSGNAATELLDEDWPDRQRHLEEAIAFMISLKVEMSRQSPLRRVK